MPLLSIPMRFPEGGSQRWAAFRDPQFRRFWCAALLDDTANWLLFAAQGWLLIQLTHRPEFVALFFLLRTAPRALLSLPAGAVVDRYGGLRVLRCSRLASALPALLLGVAAVNGQLTADLVLITAVLTAVVQAFDLPAHRSLLYSYAQGQRLIGGVALTATATTLAMLVGSLLIALLVALPGIVWALPVQVLLACGSGIVLLGNRQVRPPAVRSDTRVGGECWTALRYLASTPAIIALIVLSGSPGLLDRLVAMTMPGYADHHGGNAAGVALLFMAPATGALLGGSLLAWIGGELRRLLPLALGSSTAAVVSVSLLATTRFFLLSLLLFLVLGAAKAAFSIAIMAALQRRVPDHARGRLLAL